MSETPCPGAATHFGVRPAARLLPESGLCERAALDRIAGFTMAGRTWPREHTADLMRLLLEIDNEVGFLAT